MTVKKFVVDFIKQELDNYLHKHPEVDEVLLKNTGCRAGTQGHSGSEQGRA